MGHALAVEMRRAVKLLIRSTCSRDRPGPVRVVDKSYWRHEANGVTGQTTPHQSQPNHDRSGRGVTITDGVMPREKSPGKPTTRRYTDAEKDQAVRLVRQLRDELGTEHGTVQRVARQLGYGVESVRLWVRERDVVDGLAGPDALRVHELEERTKELEQELRETRRANEILRKASAFFAQAELDRPWK